MFDALPTQPTAAVVVATLFLLGAATAHFVPRWWKPESISLLLVFSASVTIVFAFAPLAHFGITVWAAGLADYVGRVAPGARPPYGAPCQGGRVIAPSCNRVLSWPFTLALAGHTDSLLQGFTVWAATARPAVPLAMLVVAVVALRCSDRLARRAAQVDPLLQSPQAPRPYQSRARQQTQQPA